MIARTWHGWTSPKSADGYSTFLRTKLFPLLEERVPGYRGAHVLRRQDGEEVEFLVITLFSSLDDVRGFAGSDIDEPVIEPEAQRLLSHGDSRAVHYQVETTT